MLHQILVCASFVLFSMVLDLAMAERRYCGLSLTKKLMSVCERTDCSIVPKKDEGDSHADEISTRCCRFGCAVQHMEQFCCLSTDGSSKTEQPPTVTTTVSPTEEAETPFKPKRSKHSKKHAKKSTEYYRSLKLKQMQHALEKWAEFESELETLV